MLTEGAMPEYLFRRTSGIVGLLERLLEDGCVRAIATGQECITVELLDGIELNLGNVPNRDPSAGEIPPIPASPAGAKKTNRPQGGRPRNTVLDDHGPLAEAGGR